MILSIWVFFMVGDPTPAEPGIAYVQQTAPAWQHANDPELVEEWCAKEFATRYPGHVVCECGWRQQSVKVMGG